MLFAMCVAALWALPARAQSPARVEPGRIEVSIGPVWIGRATFAASDATETTGSGGTFSLFTASTELAAARGADAHVAVRVTRTIDAEVRGSYIRPELRARIDVDAETSNAPTVVTDAIEQYTVGGAAVWYPFATRLGARARLFVTAGAGYLRQLENGGVLIVTGRTYEVGGGLKFLLKSREAGRVKGIGARLDARAMVRARGVTLDTRAHFSPFVGTSVYLRF